MSYRFNKHTSEIKYLIPVILPTNSKIQQYNNHETFSFNKKIRKQVISRDTERYKFANPLYWNNVRDSRVCG